MLSLVLTLPFLISTSFAQPAVRLDAATFTGSTSGNVDSFLGLRYALPPTGSRRLANPQPNARYSQSASVTAFGYACPQLTTSNAWVQSIPSSSAQTVYNTPGSGSPGASVSEDCLFLNVQRPNGTQSGANLPVVVWFHGGGFEIGAASQYDGTPLIQRSIAAGQPVVWVSVNYRLNAFGFLGGSQIKDAKVGNLGLKDQRLALQWLQTYIRAFGGDPRKITLHGQSAGAVSIGLHLVNSTSTALFRAAFMNSGSPDAIGPIDSSRAQSVFDAFSSAAGCSSFSDVLGCLRQLSYSSFMKAANTIPSYFSYNALALNYVPRVDGDFLTDNPQRLVSQGQYAKIPIVNGVVEDEGTLFSLMQSNVTSDVGFLSWVQTAFAPAATADELTQVATLYPSDPSAGSPYNTGNDQQVTAQSKRIASFQGDIAFQSPRRFFLSYAVNTQPVWSFLFSRAKATVDLGSYHTADLVSFFRSTSQRDYQGLDYLINFATNLDPNKGRSRTGQTTVFWPRYTSANLTLLQFTETSSLGLTTDTFRTDAINYVTTLTRKYPL